MNNLSEMLTIHQRRSTRKQVALFPTKNFKSISELGSKRNLGPHFFRVQKRKDRNKYADQKRRKQLSRLEGYNIGTNAQ